MALFGCPVVPELLVTPLLMEPVCLLSQGRFEEPVRPCVRHINEVKLRRAQLVYWDW